MVDWFVDHENTPMYPSAYMSVPANAAALPQDGDGKATGGGSAPTVSSASWNLASATASAGVISVMGASVTGLNASGSALATAIATAINASTTAVTAANGNIANVYLKALVWAVSSGAVLTVYSRIASASLNYATNSACVMATGAGWTAPPATAQFSGGVSGPWRYLFNTNVLAASVSDSVGTSVGVYGAMPATTMGAPVAGDVIHIRTKRAGADIVLVWPTAASCLVTSRSVGSLSAPLTFLTDNGVKWPGDAGVFTMKADGSLTLNRAMYTPPLSAIKQIWSGVNLSATTRNWRHEITGLLDNSNYMYRLGSASSSTGNVDILSMEATGLNGGVMNNANTTFPYFEIWAPVGSIFPRDTPSMTLIDFVCKSASRHSAIVAGGANETAFLRQVNCLWDHSGCTTASSDAMVSSFAPNGGLGNYRFEAIGCRWINFPSAANQSGWQNHINRKCTVILRDCTFDNIKMFGGTANGGIVGAAESITPDYDLLCSIQVTSTLANRPVIYETFRKAFGWFDAAAPKTVASVLPDGITTFSVRSTVTTEIGKVGKGNPVFFPRLSKINSLADGNRTAKLRILVDNNINTALGSRPPNDAEMFVQITYVGTDGLPYTKSTRAMPWITPTALTVGAGADWSATSYDVNGVSHSYSPYEISVSLDSVKGYSELGLTFGQGCQSSSVDNYVFIDPEWSLT